MEHFAIWNAVSMAWTEIGLCSTDYPEIASELRATYRDWKEVDDIIRGDVLGAFALESALFPLVMVPIVGLFLVTPFPDWGYDKAYLHKRMSRWYGLPRWQHYLNPLRLFGYPIALLFSFSLRRRLKAAFLAQPA